MGGGFTSLDPESRRVVPDTNGRPVVKIVYTVLESQYQSALTDAVTTINATNDKVCYEIIGYLLEELRDEKNMENFKKDVSDANVFIGSLIFIEDLAEKVRAAALLRRRRRRRVPRRAAVPPPHAAGPLCGCRCCCVPCAHCCAAAAGLPHSHRRGCAARLCKARRPGSCAAHRRRLDVSATDRRDDGPCARQPVHAV